MSKYSGTAALGVALLALIMSMTGLASAARHAVARLIYGHPVSSRPRPGALLALGRNAKFPAAAIPLLPAKSAKTALSAANATRVGGKTAAELTGACPAGTADIGSWCLMRGPYPLSGAQRQQGVNDYAWASQACVAVGGFLPSAAELVGAAKVVKLESTVDDNPATATVQTGTPRADQREMSSTLVTTAAGSDAAGSEGVSPNTVVDPNSGQPQPVPQPAVPFPPTLQYVTVYSNHTQGGFAGAEPVSAPENFRCGFYLKQSGR
jgi:hypothetical protein